MEEVWMIVDRKIDKTYEMPSESSRDQASRRYPALIDADACASMCWVFFLVAFFCIVVFFETTWERLQQLQSAFLAWMSMLRTAFLSVLVDFPCCCCCSSAKRRWWKIDRSMVFTSSMDSNRVTSRKYRHFRSQLRFFDIEFCSNRTENVLENVRLSVR